MILLSFELSAKRAGIALLRDSQPVVEDTWDVGHQGLFSALPRFLQQANIEARDVNIFAVGRGPGAFSGIRVALTAAQALALPTGAPVFTVSSGAVLAHETLAAENAPRVAVIGDARRGTLWYAVFNREEMETSWSLTTFDRLDIVLPGDAVRVSPDWDRLAPHLKTRNRWITAGRYPSATGVATLAAHRLAGGTASEPLEPIYMHPPV